jgi:hypothetical protein
LPTSWYCPQPARQTAGAQPPRNGQGSAALSDSEIVPVPIAPVTDPGDEHRTCYRAYGHRIGRVGAVGGAVIAAHPHSGAGRGVIGERGVIPAPPKVYPVTNTVHPLGLTATELARSSPLPGPAKRCTHARVPVTAGEADVPVSPGLPGIASAATAGFAPVSPGPASAASARTITAAILRMIDHTFRRRFSRRNGRSQPIAATTITECWARAQPVAKTVCRPDRVGVVGPFGELRPGNLGWSPAQRVPAGDGGTAGTGHVQVRH